MGERWGAEGGEESKGLRSDATHHCAGRHQKNVTRFCDLSICPCNALDCATAYLLLFVREVDCAWFEFSSLVARLRQSRAEAARSRRAFPFGVHKRKSNESERRPKKNPPSVPVPSNQNPRAKTWRTTTSRSTRPRRPTHPPSTPSRRSRTSCARPSCALRTRWSRPRRPRQPSSRSSMSTVAFGRDSSNIMRAAAFAPQIPSTVYKSLGAAHVRLIPPYSVVSPPLPLPLCFCPARGTIPRLLPAVWPEMDQFYQSLCAAFAWPEDAALTASMKAHNDAAVVAADAKVADAEKNQGEMEGMSWMLFPTVPKKCGAHGRRLPPRLCSLCTDSLV